MEAAFLLKQCHNAVPYQEPMERGTIEIITHTHRSYEKGIAGVWWPLQQRGCPIWGQQPSVDAQHILFQVKMRSERRSFAQSDSFILQLGKKNHPLSVTADLVSVTLASRLTGKHTWAQT